MKSETPSVPTSTKKAIQSYEQSYEVTKKQLARFRYDSPEFAKILFLWFAQSGVFLESIKNKT